MERRLHERSQVEFEARVTDLTTWGQPALGRVSDLSKSGISVLLPRHLPVGDRVQLEMADSILIGRVVYSNAESARFRIGIDVERVELGGSSLADLLQRALIEAMPGVSGLEPAETQLC